MRVLAAAALPALGPTLLFTFSRGAILAGIGGLVVYAVVARPRALLSGLIATAPLTAIAIKVAYNADLLATNTPTTAAAVHQGHHVARIVLACVVGAAVLRGVLLLLDRELVRIRLPDHSRARVLAGAWATSTVAVVAVLLAVGAPGYASRQYDRFVHVSVPKTKGGDYRARLADPANNGRIDEWRVATHAFADRRFKGYGAGTYQLQWDRRRPKKLAGLTVSDAHSLYAEVPGELGLVGLLLLAAALLTILVSLALRVRGPNRTVYAALLAAFLTWAVHAGADWDWEMPAVSVGAFVIGGAVLARPAGSGRRRRPPGVVARVAVALAFAALAVPPAVLALSQSRLSDSVDALLSGDCGKAVDKAHSSLDALGSRAEPYQVIGYCDLSQGRAKAAVRAMAAAVERDPGHWEHRYGLALARGAAGLDPRPAARAALQRNPLSTDAQQAVRLFATNDPAAWRRTALSAPPSVTQLGRASSGEAGLTAVAAAQRRPARP